MISNYREAHRRLQEQGINIKLDDLILIDRWRWRWIEQKMNNGEKPTILLHNFGRFSLHRKSIEHYVTNELTPEEIEKYNRLLQTADNFKSTFKKPKSNEVAQVKRNTQS